MKWTGYEKDSEGEWVYITKYGRVYHRSLGCIHLNISVRGVAANDIMSLRNKYGGKYYPCAFCGKRIEGGIVYITPDGDRYHGRMDCGGILRHISKVLLEDVEDIMSPCKDCGG